MSQTDTTKAVAAEERTEEARSFVRRVRTATRRKYTPEEKIRIVLEGFRWYRSLSLDAAVALPDGRTVGIVRRGNTSDRSAFSNRVWRLRGTALPGAVLILMPDPVRLRHSRRMLEGFPVPAFLAVESEVVAAPDGAVWSPPRRPGRHRPELGPGQDREEG